ncbi:hypothetical protein [Mucilaginibacter auburnensis]|uniref:Uncharacterized protein n=1 Tax=Mucilaginibacter auburnensis TaxID=1457233 RepID=A0A2H9VL82_9SPHI|nr:hypothetical protein [Mucilaginibacter auburnensis]PJJ79099.1 hypothetical protein CLV57_2223 [Mucilaginibacter auburnensis]
MHLSHKKSFKKVTKYILAGALTFGLSHISASVLAQSAPPPPPPPDKVLKQAGDGLKKINPFKKRRKAPAPPAAPAGAPARPGGAPPPPPNPLNLFKKGGGAPPAPPKPPGAR